MGLTGPFISTYHLVVLRHVSDLVDGDEVDDAVGIQLLGLGHLKVLLVLVGLSGMKSVRRRGGHAPVRVRRTFLKRAMVSEERLYSDHTSLAEHKATGTESTRLAAATSSW